MHGKKIVVIWRRRDFDRNEFTGSRIRDLERNGYWLEKKRRKKLLQRSIFVSN